MNCYRCKAELTNVNKSKEHIIQNFLGGRLTSTNLICNKCNNAFGSTIDKELFNQLEFAAKLLVKDSRSSGKGIEIETLAGKKKMVGHKFLPKPELTIKIPEKEVIKISGKDDNELRLIANIKKDQLEKKFGEFSLTETIEQPPSEKFHFRNSLTEKVGEICFGGSDYFRALAKIVLNFYLTRYKGGKLPSKLIRFVCGEEKNDFLFPYHPTQYTLHDLTEGEFSHVIYLRADKELRAVYCYLELFNFEKYICIIDSEFEGDDFEATYCYDCHSNKTLKKKITLDIKVHHLEIMHLISKSHRSNRQQCFFEFEKRIEKLQDI